MLVHCTHINVYALALISTRAVWCCDTSYQTLKRTYFWWEREKKAAEAEEKKLLVFTHKQKFGNIFSLFSTNFSCYFTNWCRNRWWITQTNAFEMFSSANNNKTNGNSTDRTCSSLVCILLKWMKRSNFIEIDYDGSYVYEWQFMKKEPS